MNRKNATLFALLTLALAFTSCSGVKQQICTVNCVQNGNANVTLTVFDAPPAGVDFISFKLPISSVALVSQSSGNVNVFSPANPQVFELTRLQSDSALLGTFSVAAGTYTGINVFVGAPSSIFVNSSSTTFTGCAPSTLPCSLNGGAAQLSFTFQTPLTLSGSQNLALGLEINLANAINITGNQMNINLTQANILTAVSLPRTGQASGTIDTIEDFVGKVTTLSGTTITLQDDSGVTLTGTTGSSTTFDVPPGGSAACGGNFNLACVAVGQTLSVDANVSVSGAVTLTNVDFLDLPAVDEIEGTIFPTATAGTYQMIVDHKVLAANSTNATILANVSTAFKLNIIPTVGATFAVDTSNLPVNPVTGFQTQADLVAGQRVMARVQSVAAGTLLNVATDRLVLRFSRFTGTPGTISGNIFGLQTPPAYLGINPATAPQVQTFVPQTTFDGVTDITGLNGVATPVSVRALYLNPFNGVQQPLLAANVRKH